MTRGNQRDVNRERANKRKERGPQVRGNSTLKQKDKNLTIICNICKQSFMCTVNKSILEDHVVSKHAKSSYVDCFPSAAADES